MKKISLVLLVVALMQLSAFGAQALEIVYPADKTYVVRSNYLILKGGREDVSGLTVSINGLKSGLIDISSPQYKAAFKDLLILQPQFNPGRNEIEVQGFVGGEAYETVKADIYYVDGDPTAVPASGYKPFVMHIPEREKKCEPCHNMNPDKVEMGLDTAQNNPCGSCHKRMLAKRHVHGPAGVYRCAYCHDASSRPGKYQPRAENATLCNECHMDKIEEFRKNKFVHGPVGVGLCLLCHESHGTDNISQLLAPINQLCLGCHDTVGEATHVVRGVSGSGHPLKGVPDPWRTGRELSCTSCHNPHGGMGGSFLQQGKTSAFALCGICHKK